MSDEEPKTPEPEYVVASGWLVEKVGEHTCGAGPEVHEPYCGYVPVAPMTKIFDLLRSDAERVVRTHVERALAKIVAEDLLREMKSSTWEHRYAREISGVDPSEIIPDEMSEPLIIQAREALGVVAGLVEKWLGSSLGPSIEGDRIREIIANPPIKAQMP